MKIKDAISILKSNGQKYAVVPVGDAHDILVMERGGRIFGPFDRVSGEGMFWMPELWKSENTFRDFLEADVWNIGGDRVWVAPEIQFSVTDRYKYWETLKTPNAIDPGSYCLELDENKAVLSQSLKLNAYVIADGSISLDMTRVIQPAYNPLNRVNNVDELMDGVCYCGYTQTLQLEGIGDRDVTAAAWSLLQIVPEGNVYIPMYEPHNAVNYYEPIGEYENLVPRGVVNRVTGNRRYKVGYKAVDVTGRFAYASKFEGQCYLLVRNYPNDPSNYYNEEPPEMPGENGFSFHIYNDDGNAGGFAEIECNMLSIGRKAGRSAALDSISTWIYLGSEEKLQRISKRLIGFDGIRFD